MNYSKLRGDRYFIRSRALFVHYIIKGFIIFMFFIKFANGIKHNYKKSMKHTFFLFALALLTSMVACTSQETAKLDEIDELVTNNQNEEALKRLDAYIDKHPTSADALFLRAQAHLNLDMPENAATDVESAIANWREDCMYKKSRILLLKNTISQKRQRSSGSHG